MIIMGCSRILPATLGPNVIIIYLTSFIMKLLKGARESKFDFYGQIICLIRNPNNEFRKLAEKKVQEPNISKFMQRPEYIRQRRQFMAANSIIRSEITDFSGNEFNSEQFQITWDSPNNMGITDFSGNEFKF